MATDRPLEASILLKDSLVCNSTFRFFTSNLSNTSWAFFFCWSIVCNSTLKPINSSSYIELGRAGGEDEGGGGGGGKGALTLEVAEDELGVMYVASGELDGRGGGGGGGALGPGTRSWVCLAVVFSV